MVLRTLSLWSESEGAKLEIRADGCCLMCTRHPMETPMQGLLYRLFVCLVHLRVGRDCRTGHVGACCFGRGLCYAGWRKFFRTRDTSSIRWYDDFLIVGS